MEMTGARLVRLRAGGADDPDATQTAAVLGAYFEAEQASALRRGVWRAIAIAFLLAWTLNITTSALTQIDIYFGFALAAGAVVAAMVVERRAHARLDALLADANRC